MKTKLFFIIVSITIAILNVRFNLIYFHDEIIPLSSEFIFNYFDTWSVNNIGSPSSGGIPKLIAFFFFLPFITNIPIAEIFVIAILTYVSLLYFKKLLEIWIGQNSFESILGSLLYIANPFIIFYIWRTSNLITRLWFFSFIPSNLYFLEKYIAGKGWKYFAFFAITLVLMLPGFTHPAFFIIYLLMILVVFLSKYFFENNRSIKSFFVKGLQIGLLIIFLNSVWFLPRIFTLSDELQFASSVGLSESLIKNSSFLNFANVISGVGFSSLSEAVTWYDWQSYFESGIMIFSGIIILVIIFAPLMFKEKKYSRYYIFLFTLIIGIILAYGTNSSKYTLVLFEKFQFLYAFRDPGKWYGLIIIPYVYLFAHGIYFLRKNFKSKNIFFQNGIYVICIFVVIIMGWPVFTGEATRDCSVDLPGARINIPKEYKTVDKYLTDDRILILPLMGNHFTSSWDSGPYKGVYILKSLTGKSFLTIAEPKHKNFVQNVAKGIFNGDTNLARKYNISQVILHHDLKFKNNEYENYLYALNRLDILGYKIITANDYFTLYDLTQTFSEKETKKFEVFSNLYMLNSHDADSSKYVFKYEKQKDDVINYVMKEHLKNKKIKPTKIFGRVFSLPKVLTNNTIISNLGKEDLAFNSGKLMALDGDKMFYCKKNNGQINLFFKKQDIHLSFNKKRADIIFDEELSLVQNFDFDSKKKYFFNLNNNVIFCNEDLNFIGSAQNESYLYEINNKSNEEWAIFSDINKTGDVSDCNRYDDNPQIELNILKNQDGDRIMQLSAKRHFACLYERISVEGGATYLIEFDHRSPTDSFAGYNITFLDDNTYLFDKQIDSNEKWKTYRKLITVPRDVSNILFYNYAFESDKNKKNIVEYRNVRIIRAESRKVTIGYKNKNLFSKSFYKIADISSEDLLSLSLVPPKGQNVKSRKIYNFLNDSLKMPRDCNRYDDNPQIELNILKNQDGDRIMQLSAKRHFACLYERISVEGGATYLIEFDHRSPTDSFAGYNITFLDDNTYLFDKQIDSNEKWKTYRKLITVPRDVSNILFYNYAFESDKNKKNIVEYRNVRIIQLPSIVKNIIYESDELQNYKKPDKIKVRQDLSSRKKILIRGARTPFYLAMSEGYHNQWRAQMNNKKVTGFFNSWSPWIRPDEVGINKHFKVNSYANGWFVEPVQLCEIESGGGDSLNPACTLNSDGSYDIEMVIEFWPQRWFYLGLLISGTTFFGCIGYLGWDFVRRKRRKKILKIEDREK